MPHLKAIQCYGSDADGGDKEVGALCHGNELTHELSEAPMLEQQQVEVQWLCEQAQCEIGYGQVNYEDVSGRTHGWVSDYLQ